MHVIMSRKSARNAFVPVERVSQRSSQRARFNAAVAHYVRYTAFAFEEGHVEGIQL